MATYPGGKNSRYQQIINQIPPHQVYIETHLGSGAIMRMKRPARLNIGIDLNRAVLVETAGRLAPGAIVTSDEGIPQLASSPMTIRTNIEGNARNDDGAAASKVTMPAPIVRNGVVDHPAGDIARIDDGHRLVHIVNSDDAEATSEMTLPAGNATNDDARWRFLCADALAFLQSYPFTGAEFVYSDPPYLFSTRRSQRNLYEFEYDEGDHVKLLACLKGLPCPVAISGYWSELYADTLVGWHSHTFSSKTRGGGMATEWLWMNYPSPVALHDYRYLGEGFRDRQTIKRRQQRWVKRLERMTPVEKQSMLWAISEAGL